MLVVRESFSDIVGVGHAHMGLQRFLALGLAFCQLKLASLNLEGVELTSKGGGVVGKEGACERAWRWMGARASLSRPSATCSSLHGAWQMM